MTIITTTDNILLIVLSIFLALFLLLGIGVAIQVLRLLSTVQRIAQKAETIIESAEHVGTIFKDVAGPMAAFKVIRNITHIVKGNKRGK